MIKRICIMNLITFFLLCGCSSWIYNRSSGNEIKLPNYEKYPDYKKNEITDEYYYIDVDNNEISLYEKDKLMEKYYLDLLLNMGYFISDQKFENVNELINSNIVINYPQILGFEDKKLEDKVNELIKNSALERYYEFVETDNDDFKNTEWSVEYSIKFVNQRIICILFQGYIYTMGYAHGTDIIYTVNIDMNTGKRISINELFDNSFKEKLCYKYLKGIDVPTPPNADENSVNETYSWFKNDFDNSYDNFYFHEDKFIVILPIRNYFRFFIDYNDLTDCIKYDNPIWEYFYFPNYWLKATAFRR